LLEHSLFVSPRDAASRLWAVDLALRSPAVRVVVADGSGFDVAATRRIQVLARSEMKWALVARPVSRRNRLSVAQTRWLVRGHPSSGESGGAGPRWSVELLHGKGLRTNIERPAWVLEWNRGEGVVHLSAALADLAGAPQGRGADEERSSRSA
jgi:hypothetical protein